MGRFLLGFAIGAMVGAGVALLLTPEPGSVTRARLRTQTDLYAGGDDTPAGTVGRRIEEQRLRLEEAVEAGRRASAAREAALWSKLNLPPPPPPSEGSIVE
jgi:hypothetical protein